MIEVSKTVLYTRSGKVSPSSNYRLLQYSRLLGDNIKECPMSPSYLYIHHSNAKTKKQKLYWYTLYYLVIQFNVTKYMLKNIIEKPDCVVIQRALSPKIIFPWNKLLMKWVFGRCQNLVWDFDDEIFNSKEITAYEAVLLKKYSRKIVVTSEFLRSRIDERYRSKVELMPTTDGDFAEDSLEEMLVKRKKTYDSQIELLWLATSPSLPHLHKIKNELDRIAYILENQTGKKLILHVVCNKPLEFTPKSLILDNIMWTRDVARDMIHCSHIGIMPLTDSISSKGKGGFKIIQYMSAGMPAVASAIGYNVETVIEGKTGFLIDDLNNTEDWGKAILKLANDWNVYKKFCYESRNEWNQRFSYNDNLERWKCLIKGV